MPAGTWITFGRHSIWKSEGHIADTMMTLWNCSTTHLFYDSGPSVPGNIRHCRSHHKSHCKALQCLVGVDVDRILQRKKKKFAKQRRHYVIVIDLPGQNCSRWDAQNRQTCPRLSRWCDLQSQFLTIFVSKNWVVQKQKNLIKHFKRN